MPGMASVITVLLRKNLLKMASSSASEMPRPVSVTRTTAWSCSLRILPTTCPPAGVYLIALLNRLSKTWLSRSLSPLMSRTPAAVSTSKVSPADWAALPASSAERSRSWVTERRSTSSTVVTDCSAVDRRSSTSRCRRRALRWTVPR